MSTLKACLKRARECLAGEKYTEAIQHCRTALEHDDRSYDAHVFLGKAYFLSGDTTQAETSYREAVDLAGDPLPAWKGLAEIFVNSCSVQPEATETFEKLLQHSEGVESDDKRNGYKESLAKCCIANQRPAEALALLRELPQPTASGPRSLSLIADAQAALPADKLDRDGLRDTLGELQKLTVGNPAYAKYHAHYATSLWEAFRAARWDLSVCKDALTKCRQLCQRATVPDPIIVCLRLLDISERSKEDERTMASLAAQLAHQFPSSLWAPVALAHAYYCLHMASSDAPSTQQERSLIIQMFDHGDMKQAGLIHAWLSKARMQHDNRGFAAAKATAAAALAVFKTSEAISPPAPETVIEELSVILSSCLLELGDIVKAADGFTEVAGSLAHTRGPVTGAHRRRAVAGLAACELKKGFTEEALQLYERLLGQKQPNAAVNSLAAFEHILGSSVARAQPSSQDGVAKAEHWAHGAYGWALFTAGNSKDARQQLEIAVEKAEAAGFETPDWEAAQHSWRLGRVLWELGPSHYEAAKKAWMRTVAIQGPCQASAYAWLGLLYQQQPMGARPARKCFQRALAIDPHLSIAGKGLIMSLRQAGATDAALGLCSDIAEQYPEAAWAQQQLGSLALEQGRAEEAITALQLGLRRDPANAPTWEALGAAYHMLGRFTAALKAFSRALDLDGARLYSKVQIGYIHLSLGAYSEAITAFEAAREQSPDFGPACEGAASALLASARSHQSFGAPGMAADELQKAESYANAALARSFHESEAGLKLLGDIKLACSSCGPSLKQDMQHQIPTNALDTLFTRWQWRISSVQQARRMYARALHMNPNRGSAWGDAASTFYVEAQLRRAHSRLHPEDADALCRTSETCVRGGLRIDPASQDLWACLGACAATDARREYALGRALALDPKRAPGWAALGRLYAEAGHTAMADRCLTAARSRDPSSAAAWEAMGTLASFSAAGADREAYYEEAVKLGGDVEALLGFAEAACKRGEPSAAVYVAARRAVEADLLNAAAHNALGLIAEGRSSYAEASGEYQLAIQLASSASGAQEAISVSTPDQQGQPALSISARLNLARLMSKWQPSRAVELYSQLSSEGHVNGSPEVLLAYAHALARSQHAHQAAEMLHTAAGMAPTPEVQIACLQALLRVYIELEDTGGFFRSMDDNQVLFLSAPAADMIEIWLTVQAAAAVPAFKGFESELAGRFATWQALKQDENAAFRTELLVLGGEKVQLSGDGRVASQLFARSVHQCPWKSEVWLNLAASKAVLDHNSTEIASRIMCQFGAGVSADESPEAVSACANALRNIARTHLADKAPCAMALRKALHLWPAAGNPGKAF